LFFSILSGSINYDFRSSPTNLSPYSFPSPPNWGETAGFG
jgi:hypothetical protein